MSAPRSQTSVEVEGGGANAARTSSQVEGGRGRLAGGRLDDLLEDDDDDAWRERYWYLSVHHHTAHAPVSDKGLGARCSGPRECARFRDPAETAAGFELVVRVLVRVPPVRRAVSTHPHTQTPDEARTALAEKEA